MASQVLSGSSNPTYTNTTGGNVRVIINYMESIVAPNGASTNLSITWAGVTAGSPEGSVTAYAIGKNIASIQNATSTRLNAWTNSSSINDSWPVEIMLANNQSFSAVCGPYNIVVIPEEG